MFTWWQQPPHLHNQAALETLRDFMLQGQIRPTAVAAMIFDAKYGRDAGDYRIYRKYAVGENAWADTDCEGGRGGAMQYAVQGCGYGRGAVACAAAPVAPSSHLACR